MWTSGLTILCGRGRRRRRGWINKSKLTELRPTEEQVQLTVPHHLSKSSGAGAFGLTRVTSPMRPM